jgi:hypothetical protein
MAAELKCDGCGNDLGGAYYGNVPEHGNLCIGCHVKVFTPAGMTSEFDSDIEEEEEEEEEDEFEDEFAGDRRARIISSLHRAQCVTEHVVSILARAGDVERKVADGRAQKPEADDLIDDSIDQLRRVVRYLSNRE